MFIKNVGAAILLTDSYYTRLIKWRDWKKSERVLQFGPRVKIFLVFDSL
ncbi:hypothetical protein [Rossellomorea aquimaris]|nr:hypothetical protein [Rossellomorea aquimaris]